MIDVRPLDFDDLLALERATRGRNHALQHLLGAVRARSARDHDQRSRTRATLFHAARHAGVQRIVHVSITHPSIDSPYPYFSGKALVERALVETGLPYAILRPAILFGGDGVLINNIAWLLRRLPVFAIGGDGDYRVRGIHVDDLARLCLEKATEPHDSVTDAVGPERPTFNELVHEIRDAVHSRARVMHVPGSTVPLLARVLGIVLRDVLLTRDEYHAMAAGLADSDGPTTGPTALSTWLTAQGPELGVRYANELRRHFD